MDLIDDIRTVGRPGAEPHFVVTRALEPEDLRALDEPRPVAAPRLMRLRQRHHALARLLASGCPHFECAAMTGYDIATISTLLRTPAFIDLVEFYRRKVDEIKDELGAKLVVLGNQMADELLARLEDAPEDVTLNQLMDGLKMIADRTGHGPQTTTIQEVGSVADRMDAARKRLKEIRATATDITPKDKAA